MSGSGQEGADEVSGRLIFRGVIGNANTYKQLLSRVQTRRFN